MDKIEDRYEYDEATGTVWFYGREVSMSHVVYWLNTWRLVARAKGGMALERSEKHG